MYKIVHISIIPKQAKNNLKWLGGVMVYFFHHVISSFIAISHVFLIMFAPHVYPVCLQRGLSDSPHFEARVMRRLCWPSSEVSLARWPEIETTPVTPASTVHKSLEVVNKSVKLDVLFKHIIILYIYIHIYYIYIYI